MNTSRLYPMMLLAVIPVCACAARSRVRPSPKPARPESEMERHARVLKIGDVKARRQAIEELGKMKAEARAATELLQAALRSDPDEENRARSVAALGQHGP
jgi:hypothetical protein